MDSSELIPSRLRYHPEDWRAAAQHEQEEFVQKLGTPKVWFRTLHRIYKSVFYFPDSGDEDTNNGQVWGEALDEEWEAEEQRRNQFAEDEEAWKERMTAELLRRFERWGEA